MSETQKRNLMEALADIRELTKIYPLPHRSWEKAQKALESEELVKLTQGVIKLTLWPTSPSLDEWLSVIRTCFDRLAFLLSKSCKKKIDENHVPKIVVMALYFGGSDILREMDCLLGDEYWTVMDEMRDELGTIQFDPYDDQSFSDVGVEVREERGEDNGIFFSLCIRDRKIV